jgi:hypothetical protein
MQYRSNLSPKEYIPVQKTSLEIPWYDEKEAQRLIAIAVKTVATKYNIVVDPQSKVLNDPRALCSGHIVPGGIAIKLARKTVTIWWMNCNRQYVEQSSEDGTMDFATLDDLTLILARIVESRLISSKGLKLSIPKLEAV